MTSHTEKFQRMRLAVESVITVMSMIPSNHCTKSILILFTTFLKDSLFDCTKLARLAVLLILSKDIMINFYDDNYLADTRTFICMRRHAGSITLVDVASRSSSS